MARRVNVDALVREAYSKGYRDGCNDAFEISQNLKTGKMKLTSFHEFCFGKDKKVQKDDN